jgi:hypothetical protein
VVRDTLNGPEYATAVVLVCGLLPSVVYTVVLTPEPPVSVAERVTLTGVVLYQPVVHAAPLHRIVVVGAAVSTWTAWDLTASVLPVLSTEKNLTVLVLETWNGPAYTVLDVVGVEPLVV